ncbi:MAG: glutaminyl-peptide cyclotransferase [Actinomycetota bacterium]|nr:glutaminyl-peptide cyclotransferase [Acidimicrobiia bacterium]MDQ3469760.1 glutaminyl-peptide cyclotransferase [Actinomycetota bacterium]
MDVRSTASPCVGFVVASALVLTLVATACGDDDEPAAAVEQLVVRVVGEYPHDPASFTQGLVLHDGSLYESAGGYGESSLREVDPDSGAVIRQVAVPAALFAEGLALVDDRLIQLTWKENTALVYDVDTFEQVDTFSYGGEGWGLCATDNALFMSDGSGRLTERDPVTFEPRASIDVTNQEAPVDELNELECIDGSVYANVLRSDTILEIDPGTGDVVAEIDASGLLAADERAALSSEPVLNGIADAGDGRLYLTGKLWPSMFEVELVPA